MSKSKLGFRSGKSNWGPQQITQTKLVWQHHNMEEGCFKNCDLRSAAHTNERICNANCVLPPRAPQIGDRDKITVRSFITRSHFFLFDSLFFLFIFSFDSLLILRLCTFFLSHVLAYTGISIYSWLFLQCVSLEELFLISPLQIQTSSIHKSIHL